MWVEMWPAGGPTELQDEIRLDEVDGVVGKIISRATECCQAGDPRLCCKTRTGLNRRILRDGLFKVATKMG